MISPSSLVGVKDGPVHDVRRGSITLFLDVMLHWTKARFLEHVLQHWVDPTSGDLLKFVPTHQTVYSPDVEPLQLGHHHCRDIPHLCPKYQYDLHRRLVEHSTDLWGCILQPQHLQDTHPTFPRLTQI